MQPGDTLTGIAQRFGVSLGELVRMNRLRNPDLIFVGQMLQYRRCLPKAPPVILRHVLFPSIGAV